MANVYIVAGPPGIGKSTAGYYFIPEDLDILDADLIADRYKTAGFSDYKDIGNLKFQNIIRGELFRERDFAIELNLGFQSHYDFVKSIKNFNSDNQIIVILFYTDDIDLCHERAEKRHQAGLHLVKPEVIKEMYDNTISLMMSNFKIISTLLAVNIIRYDVPKRCIDFDKSEKKFILNQDRPIWVSSEFEQFLKDQISEI